MLVLEPVGVCREDAKKPDGMTFIPWENRQALVGFHFLRHTGSIKSHEGQ